MGQDLCGKWMPRKQTTCARTPGHGGSCKTAEVMERQREYSRAHPHRHGDGLRALALDAPVATTTDIHLRGHLPAPVEAEAYFAVAEALANVAKHAGARSVHIRASLRPVRR